MYLIGAGGHAKVIIEILQSKRIAVQGVFDDNPAVKQLWKYPVTPLAGSGEQITSGMIISIGNNAIRKKLRSACIHASAWPYTKRPICRPQRWSTKVR